MRARPARVARRGKRRTAVWISLTLTGPTRVVFVVRGPAPSCSVAGRFSVRGHRGVNHVRFTGRVGRRKLPSGTYRISAITSGRAANRSVVVVLGEHAPPTRFQCRSPRPQASPFVSMLAAFTPRTGPARAAPKPDPVMKKPAPAGDEPDSGVLPAVTDRLRKLPDSVPKPQLPNTAASPPWILGAAALLLLVVSSLTLLVYLIRFLRGPQAT
jgi:hypothetical protein